jgi:hypothetical protein
MAKSFDTDGELLEALRKQRIPVCARRQIVRKAARARRRKEGQHSPRSVAGLA